MSPSSFSQLRWRVTGLVALAAGALLAWRFTHGGIPRHHLLHRADMPAISTAWDALVLPLLTWGLLGRARPRVPSPGWIGLTGGLIFGMTLAALFTAGQEAILAYLVLIPLVLALALPIHRAECMLGFVLGMAFTFGAIIPTVFSTVVAILGAGIHLLTRPIRVRVAPSLPR